MTQTPEANTDSRKQKRTVRQLVSSRVSSLQKQMLVNESSAARGVLAQLRKGAVKAPGELPAIWDITQDPDSAESTFEQPTWRENAIHLALTTYANHQRSASEAMHVEGWGLGRAARSLIEGESGEESPSLRARFNALITASTFTTLSYHLRTFVSLLRSNGIPLDYGLLAQDLERYQKPGQAKAVRLKWSREYYFVSSETKSQTN